jgi:hypothetical protein
MNRASSHLVNWVYTKEFGNNKFPLVYLSNGNLSYSLLCFINSKYKDKEGKVTTKMTDLFRVVGELNQYCLRRKDMKDLWEEKPQLMLKEYFEDRYFGTITPDGCPYGLYWHGISHTILKKLISAFEGYADYVAAYLDYSVLDASELYATKRAAEGQEFYQGFKDKKKRGLLQHLETQSNKDKSWNSSGLTPEHDPKLKGKKSEDPDYKFFPPEKVKELIMSANDINQQAMYLLSSFTSLRASEGLHLLTTDIIWSGKSMLFHDVILSEPFAKTCCPKTNKPIDRITIIKKKHQENFDEFSLDKEALSYAQNPLSRMSVLGRYHVGWKGITVNDEKDSDFGHLLQWQNDYARVAFENLIPELLAQKRAGHSYLFCNKDGMPLPYNTYYKRIYRASKAICDTHYGTHSLRHFCGFYQANTLGFSKEKTQINMRHASILSTEHYYHLTLTEAKYHIEKNLAFKASRKSKWDDLDFKELKYIRVNSKEGIAHELFI